MKQSRQNKNHKNEVNGANQVGISYSENALKTRNETGSWPGVNWK